MRVVKGVVNCAGGGDESPEGVGEVNSLRSFAPGRDDTMSEGASFSCMFIEVLDVVAGVYTRSSGFELSIESPSAMNLDSLSSELSEAEERLERDDTEVDTDGFRRRSRVAVMTIEAGVLFTFVGFIPLGRDHPIERWYCGVDMIG